MMNPITRNKFSVNHRTTPSPPGLKMPKTIIMIYNCRVFYNPNVIFFLQNVEIIKNNYCKILQNEYSNPIPVHFL